VIPAAGKCVKAIIDTHEYSHFESMGLDRFYSSRSHDTFLGFVVRLTGQRGQCPDTPLHASNFRTALPNVSMFAYDRRGYCKNLSGTTLATTIRITI
jgi:hypothetical protein